MRWVGLIVALVCALVAPPVGAQEREAIDVVVLGGEAAVSETTVAPLELPVRRLAGATRIETAVAASASTFAPGIDAVFVATAGAFPDALAVAPLAATVGGPVLLTHGGHLPEAVVEEVLRLRPGRAVVVGGEAAVSASVVERLGSLVEGPVERVAGPDRFGTAAAVARRMGSPTEVFVARGDDFRDALVVAPLAARVNAPLLLVRPEEVPNATRSLLEELTTVDPLRRLTILGGPAAVGANVATDLSAFAEEVTRVAGADSVGTAVEVSRALFPDGTTPASIFLATIADYPDALAGSVLAALSPASPTRQGARAVTGPILLTHTDDLPRATRDEIRRLTQGAGVTEDPDPEPTATATPTPTPIPTETAPPGGGRPGPLPPGPTNRPPVVNAPLAQGIVVNGSTDPVVFQVDDPDEDQVTVTATSDDPTLLPADGLAVAHGPDGWTVMITPAAGETGSAVVTLTAADGLASGADDFDVIVVPEEDPSLPDPPIITSLTHQPGMPSAHAPFEAAWSVDEALAPTITGWAVELDRLAVTVPGADTAQPEAETRGVLGAAGPHWLHVRGLTSDGQGTRTAHFRFDLLPDHYVDLFPGATVFGTTTLNIVAPPGPATLQVSADGNDPWIAVAQDNAGAFTWPITGNEPAVVRVVDEGGAVLLPATAVTPRSSPDPMDAAWTLYERGLFSLAETFEATLDALIGEPPPELAGLTLEAEPTLGIWRLFSRWHRLGGEEQQSLLDLFAPAEGAAAGAAAGDTVAAQANECQPTDRLPLIPQSHPCLRRLELPEGPVVNLYYRFEDPVAYVDRIARGISDAVAVHHGNGFRMPTEEVQVITGLASRPISLPVGTILLGNDTDEGTVRHELFHQVEWAYVNPADGVLVGTLPGRINAGLPQILWFAEASAEWATHQVNDARPITNGRDYARSLPEFLDAPHERINRFEPFANDQYGAFVFAEYIEQRVPDGNRMVWEAMESTPVAILATAQVLEGGPDSTDDMILNFRLWSYGLTGTMELLDGTAPGVSIDANVGEDSWRDFLSAESATAESPGEDPSQARAARTRVARSGSGELRQQPAGASYLEVPVVDLVDGLPAESTVLLDVVVPAAERDHVQMALVGFHDYPTVCAQPVVVEPDRGRVLTELRPDCATYTLVAVDTRLSLHGVVSLPIPQSSVEWNVEVLPAPDLRLGLNQFGQFVDDAADIGASHVDAGEGILHYLNETDYFLNDMWGVAAFGGGSVGTDDDDYFVSTEPPGVGPGTGDFTGLLRHVDHSVAGLEVTHALRPTTNVDAYLVEVTVAVPEGSSAQPHVRYRRSLNFVGRQSGGADSGDHSTGNASAFSSNDAITWANNFPCAPTDPTTVRRFGPEADPDGPPPGPGPRGVHVEVDLGVVGPDEPVSFRMIVAAAPSVGGAVSAAATTGADWLAYEQVGSAGETFVLGVDTDRLVPRPDLHVGPDPAPAEALMTCFGTS